MGRPLIYGTAALVLAGGWLVLTTQSDSMLGFVRQYVENSEFVTLEARYSPEQIVDNYRKEFPAGELRNYQEPTLKFHPYLLMEVKYTQPDKKSREAVAFWSLIDGEMVLNTDTWEKTHGFEDAINAGATRTDFQVLYVLARNKGSATLDQVQKELRIDKEQLPLIVSSALTKHLIVQRGNELFLHFQNPKFLVRPETQTSHWLVSKPYDHAQRFPRKYSGNQVQRIAKAAFGDDFTIRSTTEVFLPVYAVDILNPDGSVLTTHWNALTGQKIQPKYLSP